METGSITREEDTTLEAGRCSPEELTELLRQGREGPVLVDLRRSAAHRRAHPPGAISIPAARLLTSLFLLPPRDRRLVLLAGVGQRPREHARALAVELRHRGWSGAEWLDGSVLDFEADLRISGRTPNRTWQPAEWLRRAEPRLPRDGLACDLACGSGRNAVFLAVQGRRVIGVDILADALRQGRALARAAGVVPPGAVTFHGVDLRDARASSRFLRPGRFALITCFRYLQRPLFVRLAEALSPGGWIVYETYLAQQAESGRKPRSPAHLLQPGELLRALPGLEVMDYFEGQDGKGDWVASLAARKSPS